MRLTKRQRLIQHLKRWRKDPIAFIREVLKVEPTHQQLAMIEAVVAHRFVAIRSGNKVGKTAVCAWLTIWFMCCFKSARVPCTSPSEGQLIRGIWQEVGKWYRKLPTFFKDKFILGATALTHKEYKTSWQAYIKTATKENPEVLSGAHSNNIFLIFDEGSGIDREIVDNVLPLLGSVNAYCIMTGNPLRTSGYFFDLFHGKPSIFKKQLHYSAEESPLMPKATLDAWIEAYGSKEHSYYKIHALGDFPESDSDQLIPLYSVSDAVDNSIVLDTDDDDEDKPDIIWGIDIGLDHDASVIAKRQGRKLYDLKKFVMVKDTVKLSGLIREEYNNTPDDKKPFNILVDEIGIGRGTLDTLAAWGLPVQGVNVGTAASDSKRFANLKAELWYKCKDWFLLDKPDIPDDRDLVTDLVTPKYQTNPSGKLKIESKDQIRKRLGRSTDCGDGLVLTFVRQVDLTFITSGE